MAFTSPFFQSTQAQGIINNYLNNTAGGLPPFTAPSTNPYIVDSTPYVPPAAQPTPDDPVNNTPNCEELYPGEGRVYDPVLQACVLPEMNPQEGDSDNNEMNETYRGVGSAFSPEQNAFMNLGLGGSTADDVQSYFNPNDPDRKLDLYGDGLSGLYKRFTPFGQLGVYMDANTLANAGVINKRDDGGYSFAKGGNLNLVQANQAFENQLAQKNMMDFAQNNLGKTAEEAQAMADVTKRGDKADYMGSSVYKDNNANVNINPFQSNFGASNIVSYSPPDPNREKSESEKMFERKRAFVSPKKQINSKNFTGMGYTRGR
jgi:hypothetical protein